MSNAFQRCVSPVNGVMNVTKSMGWDAVLLLSIAMAVPSAAGDLG